MATIAPPRDFDARQPAKRLSTTIIDEHAGRTLVRAAGFLDVYTAPEFRAELELRVGDRDVLIDMTGIVFIDAAGIGLLMSIVGRLHRHGCRVAFVCNETIAGAVQLAGVDGAVSVCQRH
jgi:anti-sigma B factor antagonist